MTKYIIKWDAGFGMNYELVDCEDRGEALDWARREWKEEVESNADYGALEFTLENAENYGFEDEHPDYEEER